MDTTAKKKPTKLVMLRDYEIALNGKKVVISRDFFSTMCPSQLNGDWAAITVKFRPWTEKCAVNPITKIVNADSAIAENNEACCES